MTARLLLALLGMSACAPPSAHVEIETHAWPAMSYAQRLRFMESTVSPEMKRLFMTYDPHKFGGFGCRTCHGSDGEARRYAMPNPGLLLEPSPWNTGAATPEGAPDAMSAFMATVSVRMGTLLERPVGCFTCHTEER